jgi:hypothetical protein
LRDFHARTVELAADGDAFTLRPKEAAALSEQGLRSP